MVHYQTKMLSKIFKVVIVLLLLSFCLPLAGYSQTTDRVDRLIQKLGSEDGDVRVNAGEALIEIGEPAVEPLITALRDERLPWIQEEIVKTCLFRFLSG